MTQGSTTLRVAVFGENRHEKVDPRVQELYPDGMHTTIAEALRLGRRAQRISRQNIAFSIALLVFLIPSALVGALTVVAAVLVHEVSELLAVANGVRAARGVAPEPA